MTAKEYLKRIRKLDHDIDRKQYEFETLKKRRTYISGMDYSADRVQMSSDGEDLPVYQIDLSTCSEKLIPR